MGQFDIRRVKYNHRAKIGLIAYNDLRIDECDLTQIHSLLYSRLYMKIQVKLPSHGQ